MKIKKIKLNDYNQFEGLEIGLTYPNGHEKEGKPLDKVCIIGQSGTGKTSLLRLIKWFVSFDRNIGENVDLPLPPDNGVEMHFELPGQNFQLACQDQEYPYLYVSSTYTSNIDNFWKRLNNYRQKTNPILINFPTELISQKKQIRKNGEDVSAPTITGKNTTKVRTT